MSREHEIEQPRSISEPLRPSLLPPELADFLKDRPFACLMQATDKGTAFVIKAPTHEIESVRGRVPIYMRHELYEHPAAPVIRTVITIYDQPRHPLALDCFTNVEDAQQRADFAALNLQKSLYMLFYDELVHHRLTKEVPNLTDNTISIAQMVNLADNILSGIPDDRFDFDKAKAEVMRRIIL